MYESNFPAEALRAYGVTHNDSATRCGDLVLSLCSPETFLPSNRVFPPKGYPEQLSPRYEGSFRVILPFWGHETTINCHCLGDSAASFDHMERRLKEETVFLPQSANQEGWNDSRVDWTLSASRRLVWPMAICSLWRKPATRKLDLCISPRRTDTIDPSHVNSSTTSTQIHLWGW